MQWRGVLLDEPALEGDPRRRRARGYEVDDSRATVVLWDVATRRATARRSIERKPSAEGYLLGGEVSVSEIARMFDVVRDLVATDAWDCLPGDCMLRADVSGPVIGTAWILVDALMESIELLDAPALDDEGTRITRLQLEPRIDVPWDHLRERCAYGWPLAPGGEVPMLVSLAPDGTSHAPTPSETLHAVAACAALAEHSTAIRALGRRHERGEAVGAERWESEIALDEGDVRVRLTASDASAPWPAPGAPPSGVDAPSNVDGGHARADGEEWDGDESDNHDYGDELDRHEHVRVAREAFVDWALTCGLPLDDIALAADLVASLADYVRDERPGTLWYESTVLEGFLTRYAPRKLVLDDDAIERTPAALELLVGWLTEAGYFDARGAEMLRKIVIRASATFRERMREPRGFGLAKGFFAEMERAGVDVVRRRASDLRAPPSHALAAAAAATRSAASRAERARSGWSPRLRRSMYQHPILERREERAVSCESPNCFRGNAPAIIEHRHVAAVDHVPREMDDHLSPRITELHRG